MSFQIRESTRLALEAFDFRDDAGKQIIWTEGQLEIIDCIVNRESPDHKTRIEIIAATRYGKSIAVAAGVLIRVVTKPEKWAIVAGTKDKARIIQEYIVMFALNNPMIRTQLVGEEALDRMRMKHSQDEIGFRRKGRVKVFSADATKVNQVSNALMGFGSPNIIEDESSLVPDVLQAKVMRMLGDSVDNFLVKIGNPFNRNHFLRTWKSERYYKIFIDYERGIREGRYTEDYISEMRDEPLFDILYGCLFPEEGTIDESGWLPLLTDTELERCFVEDEPLVGTPKLGGDVAGGGRNYSTMVVRAVNVARLIYKENQPDTMLYAGSVVAKARIYSVNNREMAIDKVGIGKGATDRIKEMVGSEVGVSGGETPNQPDRFVNARAEWYWRGREWLLHGGKLIKDDDWYQLTRIKWKPQDGTGKIIIMSKQQMLKEGVESPDVADGFSLTFVKSDMPTSYQQPQMVNRQQNREAINDDPY
jgi:hypothetical protein